MLLRFHFIVNHQSVTICGTERKLDYITRCRQKLQDGRHPFPNYYCVYKRNIDKVCRSLANGSAAHPCQVFLFWFVFLSFVKGQRFLFLLFCYYQTCSPNSTSFPMAKKKYPLELKAVEWVWGMVWRKEGTYADGVREQGAEGGVWAWECASNRRF